MNYNRPEIEEPGDVIGVHSSLIELATELVELDQRVSIVYRGREDHDASYRGIQLHFVADQLDDRPGPLKIPRRFHGRILSLDPDIVHVNSALFPTQTAALVARLNAPLLIQNHAEGPPQKALGTMVTRASLAGVSAFIFTDRDQATPWIAAGILDSGQVEELIEGSTRFGQLDRSEARRRLDLDGSPLFLWIGRLDSNKDPITVLEGLSSYLVQNSDAALVMIHSGPDPLLEEVDRMIENAAHGRIDRIGRVDHELIESYLSAADYFVVGSHHEGSGFALIEAIACGTVPLVTDIPSHRSITRGIGVRLWSPGDADDLSRLVDETTAVPLDELRTRVLEVFRSRLSYAVLASDLLEIYRRHLGN